jgi:hypothetical protein
MNISDKRIDEFIDIYEHVHGERLSHGEARIVAGKLVMLYRLLLQAYLSLRLSCLQLFFRKNPFPDGCDTIQDPSVVRITHKSSNNVDDGQHDVETCHSGNFPRREREE